MTDLTVVIANYRRPGNLETIAANLPSGTRLFVVDNAVDGEFRATRAAASRAEWMLSSSRNNLATRWYMAAQADTAYYCVHDDDLMLRRDDYRRYVDAMAADREISRRVLTGPFGVRLIPGMSYVNSHHSVRHGSEVDIIKGRMMFGAVDYLRGVPQCPRGFDCAGVVDPDDPAVTVISEDIFASATLAREYRTRLLVTNLGPHVELPAPFASSSSPAHRARREYAARKLFPAWQQASTRPPA